MRLLATLCLVGSSAALAGCMHDMAAKPAGAGAKDAPPATATLTTGEGVVVGTATLTPRRDGIRLVLDARGMAPGPHGFHIHTVGRCEAPGFTSAGAHWNPTAMKHGKDAPDGPHSGDMPNLIVGTDGTGKLEATLPGTLTEGPNALLDADGASVIVHAAADDYKTDPSGNSGGRLACGVVNAG